MPDRQSAPSPIGLLLKEWRRVRRKSQLAVALEARISPRHLSFVESGRSVPSREMVSTLADALAVPLRERNALLLAAGYAPRYPERRLDSSEMVQVGRALERLLRHQEPYPAVVLDRQWNIVETNRAAPKLFGRFIDLERLPEPRNLLRSFFDPTVLRPWIVNWEEVAASLIDRVCREAVAGVPDERVLALLEDLRGSGNAPPLESRAASGSLPFLPVQFRKDQLVLSFFSMLTTVGVPTDITAQELRIEAFFPADDATEAFAREHLASDLAARRLARGLLFPCIERANLANSRPAYVRMSPARAPKWRPPKTDWPRPGSNRREAYVPSYMVANRSSTGGWFLCGRPAGGRPPSPP